MKKRIVVSIVAVAMVFSQFSFTSGKELLKKNANESEAQTGSERELEAERKLEEEKQALLTEEEDYSSQYLVWHGAESLDTDILAGHAQQVYVKAKAQKAKKEKVVKGKIKDSEAKQEFIKQLEIDGSDSVNRMVEQAEIESTAAGYDIIRLPEKVDPALFTEGVQEAAGGDVISIQPDYIMELASEVDADAKAESRQEADVVQEELENEGPAEEEAVGTEETEEEISDLPEAILDRDADLQEAWKRSKGTGVTIALIDTGVDTAHPDLEGHVLEGYDFVNDRKGVYDAELGMEQAHGTHVAGIIAGAAPEADILPLKVFENGRAYTSDILEAIVFAKEQGAAVVNMSFGSTDNNQALRQAMEESGMFFVCAAGNHRRDLGETPIYPAAFGLENSISVAALNQDLGLSYFSNYGESVDIAAWGRDVDSCFPEGEHGLLDGTSMAAGYVSAAAALAFQELEEGSLKERLKSTSDRITCLDGKIAQGNKLSFSGAVYGIVKNKIIDITPEEEFEDASDVSSPEEMWELFGSKHNTAIVAGDTHGLALKEDGTLWSWGTVHAGGLGDTDAHTKSFSPVMVMLNNVVDISAGRGYSIALTKDGTVYAWGANNYGQLGNGTTDSTNYPTRVTIASSYGKVIGISAGSTHCLALTEQGKVLGWGRNEYGQLGMEPYTPALTPVNLPELKNITEVSAGQEQSTALDENGNVWISGMYPPGHIENGGCCRNFFQIDMPWEVKKLSEGGQVRNALLVKTDGSVWGWGLGNLGDGQDRNCITQMPQYIGGNDRYGFQKMVQVSIGADSDFALRQDGAVWGWGENKNGELGIGTTDSISYARQIHTDVKAISMGTRFSLMLKNDGTIVASGDNTYGQCAQPESIKRCLSPLEINFANFSESTADPLELDKGKYGTLTKNTEVRVYSFTPSIEGTYTFESISNINLVGSLSKKNESLQMNNDGGGVGESTNAQDFYMKQDLQAGQTYYLRIYTFRNSPAGSYTLKVKLWDDCGNSIRNALPIREGRTDGRIDYDSDVDVYAFIPEKTGFYGMSSTSIHGVMGNIYDSKGEFLSVLYRNIGEPGNPSEFYSRHKLLAGKQYFIKIIVGRDAQTFETYTLNISYKDDYSDNRNDADPVQGGEGISGRIDYAGDVDMFQFVPEETACYTMETISNFDTYGILYDSSGKQIGYNDDGYAKGESTNNRDFCMKYKLVENTVYYIAVKAYSSTATGPYVFKVSCKDDYGGVMSTAHDISESYMTEGTIDYFGDTDAFVFIPKSSGTYILSTVGNTTLGGVSFKVDNNSNTTSLPLTYQDENVRVEFNMQANEKHYFMVYNKDNSVSSIGEYKVYVETPLTVEVE